MEHAIDSLNKQHPDIAASQMHAFGAPDLPGTKAQAAEPLMTDINMTLCNGTANTHLSMTGMIRPRSLLGGKNCKSMKSLMRPFQSLLAE